VFTGNSAAGTGGALHNQNTQVILHGCVFAGNKAGGGGATGNGDHANVAIRDCQFVRNSASSGGGAMHNAGKCKLSLRDCTFLENASEDQGGGIFSESGCECTFVGCVFDRNHSRQIGGALRNYDECRIHLVNCLLTRNTVESAGGAIYNEKNNQLDLINCTIACNTAGDEAGGIRNAQDKNVPDDHGSALNLTNCIFWGNSVKKDSSEAAQLCGDFIRVRNCCIQGWTGQLRGPGNFALDPLFADPNGRDGKIGSLDDNWRLGPGSPCRDAGDNSALGADTLDLDGDADPNEPIPFDVEGRPRIHNGRVDIGAYESDSPGAGGGP
jgi:hypothetical protein